MKGLILKDFYIIKNEMKTTIILLLFVIFSFSFFMEPTTMAAVVPTFFCMMAGSTVAYDETAKWDRYARSCPLPAVRIIMGKYIFCLLAVLTGAATSFFACGGSMLLRKISITGDFFTVIAASALAGLFLNCVILPCYFKFGAEKGRVLFLIIAVIPVLGITLLNQMEITLPQISFSLLFIMICLAIPLCFIISFFLSLKIYYGKEF